MLLKEKLLKLRRERGLTQEQVADAVGITRRAYLGYEKEGKHPKSHSTYEKLADVLKCDVEYLDDENAEFVMQAAEEYGSRGKKQAEELLEQFSGLFAGGELTEEDKDGVMDAMKRIYRDCKEDNKKYTPKKYREPQQESQKEPKKVKVRVKRK